MGEEGRGVSEVWNVCSIILIVKKICKLVTSKFFWGGGGEGESVC